MVMVKRSVVARGCGGGGREGAHRIFRAVKLFFYFFLDKVLLFGIKMSSFEKKRSFLKNISPQTTSFPMMS